MPLRPIAASAQHTPHVVLGRSPELKVTEPLIESRRRQVTQAKTWEGICQLPCELPAQEDVMRREARLFPRSSELLRYFDQGQPGHVRPVMPQEELDRFPQGRFAEFRQRLRVFLDRHMQRVVWGENLPRRDEAFQFRCCKGVNRDRVFRQSAKDGSGYSLGFRLVRKVLLDPSASGIIGELVHRLTAIDGVIKFDCLLTI